MRAQRAARSHAEVRHIMASIRERHHALTQRGLPASGWTAWPLFHGRTAQHAKQAFLNGTNLKTQEFVGSKWTQRLSHETASSFLYHSLLPAGGADRMAHNDGPLAGFRDQIASREASPDVEPGDMLPGRAGRSRQRPRPSATSPSFLAPRSTVSKRFGLLIPLIVLCCDPQAIALTGCGLGAAHNQRLNAANLECALWRPRHLQPNPYTCLKPVSCFCHHSGIIPLIFIANCARPCAVYCLPGEPIAWRTTMVRSRQPAARSPCTRPRTMPNRRARPASPGRAFPQWSGESQSPPPCCCRRTILMPSLPGISTFRSRSGSCRRTGLPYLWSSARFVAHRIFILSGGRGAAAADAVLKPTSANSS
jgi:hypothetical protein